MAIRRLRCQKRATIAVEALKNAALCATVLNQKPAQVNHDGLASNRSFEFCTSGFLDVKKAMTSLPIDSSPTGTDILKRLSKLLEPHKPYN